MDKAPVRFWVGPFSIKVFKLKSVLKNMGFYQNLRQKFSNWKRNFLINTVDNFETKIRDIETTHIRLRITDRDGLTRNERRAIESCIKSLGYEDLNDFVTKSGYNSPREMAYDHRFKNVRDFFLADGWYERLNSHNKNTIKKGLENSASLTL